MSTSAHNETDWESAPNLLDGAMKLHLTPEECGIEYWLEAAIRGTLAGQTHGHLPDVAVPEHLMKDGPLRNAILDEFAFRAVSEDMSELYCIIQFYPRVLRREGVNVGVVVLSERHGAIRVKLSSSHDLARKHFGAASFDDTWLSSAKRSLGRRLRDLPPRHDALLDFIAKEAGQLVVLPPRPVVVDDPDSTVALLFDQLVGEPEQRPLADRDRAERLLRADRSR